MFPTSASPKAPQETLRGFPQPNCTQGLAATRLVTLKQYVWVFLVAGIVGVLVFLATRTDEDRVRPPAAAPDTSLVQSSQDPLTDGGPSSEPSKDQRAVVPLDVLATSPPDEGAGWRVCVLGARTNAAVRGATVTVVDSAIARELAPLGIGYDTLAGLRLRRERALEARTGADGCAQFAAPPEHAIVEARSDADWAFTVVNGVPKDRCVTLRLAADRSLLVRVVDGAGIPVGGVPVALRRKVDSQPTFTWKWTDTEGTTGLATFQHFQRRLEQGAGWHALFAFPVRDEPLVPVDALTPIEPPITLVLPDTGRVRIRVRTRDGTARDLEGVNVQLDAFERGLGGPRLWPDGPWARPHLDATGDALVSWIGLGLQIEVALVQDGEELVARSFTGPAHPGEEVLCELVLSRPFVKGRFVLRDGRAWPAATVKALAVLFPTPKEGPLLREIGVGTDGRFRMPVHEVRPVAGTRAYRFFAPHPEGGGDVLATVPLDQDVPPDGLDLGDVVLDYGELLVCGRVVDTARRPIPGATLRAHSRVVVAGEELWPLVPAAGTVRTGVDGRFALYLQQGEQPPSEELRVAASAEGFVAEVGHDVHRGERDAEIVLEQAGSLAGSLDLERGLTPDDVELTLSERSRHFVQLRSDSTFDVSELLPGIYSLEVRRRGANGRLEREPAVRVDGLLVVAGETCRDPRIQALRIASVVASLRIRIVDRASTPLPGAATSIVGLENARPALSQDDGLCWVRSETLPVDLEVSAFGYLRRRLVNVSEDREVVLDVGIPIRLRTSAKPIGSSPQYLLGVRLYSVDASGVRRSPAWGPEYTAGSASDRSHFDTHGELWLRMPSAGVYDCDVFVTVLRDRVGRGASVEVSPTPRITVHASDTEQLFELSIRQKAVDAAVERASK